MGDTTLLSQYAENQHSHKPQPATTAYAPVTVTPAAHARNGVLPSPDGVHDGHDVSTSHTNAADDVAVEGEEEPYTIRCICGFADDDGNTVLCERCNTWQHISCYYFPKERLDDDFHHLCADCQPRRELDPASARSRQRRLRAGVNQSAAEERKPKRAPKSGHKKTKTKDLTATAQTNGWYLHDSSTSAATRDASPRDQQNGPPPAKKPKTSHKASPSLSGNFRGVRPSSHLTNPHPIPPPLHECPPDWFSPDFVKIHRQNTSFAPTHTSIHTNIGTTNLLSELLDDEDAFAHHTQGRTHNEVFKHLPHPFKDLELPRWEVNTEENQAVQFYGEHPIWKTVTVDQDLCSGQILGELTGSIGKRDEYQSDPANRWGYLHHPDYFVFFHPVLPIYIDCCTEGTELRYVRRSCRPNLKMETLIVGERDFHFVLTATDDIPAGSEVTIGWDTSGLKHGSLDEFAKSGGPHSMDESTVDFLSDWAQRLLAHFGGCPCDKLAGPVCLMDHFDRRIPKITGFLESRPTKNGKKRKPSRKDSPLPDHLLSRGSSEAVVRDDEDDMEESRSTTHSSQSENSRSGTPSGYPKHFGNELSEREKKKLLQQERLFEQMEQDQQSGQKRKKRHSGSNANTPVAETSSKQNGRSQNGLSDSSSTNHKGPNGVQSRRPVNGTNGSNSSSSSTSGHNRPSAGRRTASGQSNSQEYTKPVYVDSWTQTEPEEPPAEPAVDTSPSRRPPRVSLVKKIMRRSLLRRVNNPDDEEHVSRPASASGIVESTKETEEEDRGDAMEIEIDDTVAVAESTSRLHISPISSDPATTRAIKSEALSPTEPLGPSDSLTEGPSHLSKPQPPPLWESSGSQPTSASSSASKDAKQSRATKLHVDLPPPPTFTGSATDGITQLPMNAPSPTNSEGVSSSLMSPPDGSLTKPTPIKKKMSLSDYTKRRKTETPSVEKSQLQAQLGDIGEGRMDSEEVKSPAGSDKGSSSTANAPSASIKVEDRGSGVTEGEA